VCCVLFERGVLFCVLCVIVVPQPPGKNPFEVRINNNKIIMLDLWWTKWHWGRFSPSTSVSSANSHSTDCSTLIIYHPGLVQ
jgi:hypothetical protein